MSPTILVLLPHWTGQNIGTPPLTVTWHDANPPELIAAAAPPRSSTPVFGWRRYHLVGTVALYVMDAELTRALDTPEDGHRIHPKAIGICGGRQIFTVRRPGQHADTIAAGR